MTNYTHVKEKDKKRGVVTIKKEKNNQIMNINLRKPITMEDFSNLKTILGVLNV
jgi:hypothetical protein